MPETLIGMFFELATHAGRAGIDHAAKRVNRAYGLDQPAPAFRPLPPMPELRPLPPMPEMPALASFGGASGAAAALAARPIPANRTSGPQTGQGAFGPPSRGDSSSRSASGAPGGRFSEGSEGYSYSDEVAAGVACLNCTRGHVSAMNAGAKAAQEAAARGDMDEARRQLVFVAEEAAVLREFDWDPALLARTPASHVAVVDAVAPCVDRVETMLGVPRPVAMAAGSAKEARRFALSTNPTPRDRHEIERRLRVVDAQGNYAERALVGARWDDAGLQAGFHLREGRHHLDQRDPYAADTLAAAGERFSEAAVALTPLPDPATVARIADECKACSDTFYAAYLKMLQTREGAAS